MSLNVCSSNFCHVAGPDASPNASRLYINDPPQGDRVRVLWRCCGRMGTLKKAERRSMTLKTLAPCNFPVKSFSSGRGCASTIVWALSARKSVQGRAPPPGLGTRWLCPVSIVKTRRASAHKLPCFPSPYTPHHLSHPALPIPQRS